MLKKNHEYRFFNKIYSVIEEENRNKKFNSCVLEAKLQMELENGQKWAKDE